MNASRILTQNVQGLPEEDDTKLKSIINQMKNENWDAACLQNMEIGNWWPLHRQLPHLLPGQLDKDKHQRTSHGRSMHHPITILQPSTQKEQKRGDQIRHRRIFWRKNHRSTTHLPKCRQQWEKIKGELDITLCSIYHPVDNIEFENFNTILSSILTQLPPETKHIILGHNINANVGTSANNGQHLKERIGAYGIENRNKKSISLINLMAPLNMKITKFFFNPRPSNLDATTMHTTSTWRNPNASKSQHMLDVFSCLNTFFNWVQGCNPTRKGAESDHTAAILKIHISKLAFKMKDKKLTTKTDWE